MRRYPHPLTPLITAHAMALTLSLFHPPSHIPYMPRCTTPARLTTTTCRDDASYREYSAEWPSGLRRRVQAAVRKGVGSDPTSVTFAYVRSLSVCCEHEALLYRSLEREGTTARGSCTISLWIRMSNKRDVGPKMLSLIVVFCRYFLVPPNWFFVESTATPSHHHLSQLLKRLYSLTHLSAHPPTSHTCRAIPHLLH